MSITGLASCDVAAAAPHRAVVDVDEEAVGGTTDALDDIEALPFTWPEGPFWAASIDPKVTVEPARWISAAEMTADD